MNTPKVNTKISKKAMNELRRSVKAVFSLIDKKENEFLLPYVMNHTGGRKPTVLRLSKRGIKRLFNPDTYEVWYEMNGQVITPSFFRNPKVLEDVIADIDREKSTDSNS